jgi:hypothetical protein
MSGYNEGAYHQARQSVLERPCPFERALLSSCVACSAARKLLLAERELIQCSQAELNPSCQALYAALHSKARFALHMVDPVSPWPFGKEIRAQCGGLLGLQAALQVDTQDVAAWVGAALAREGGLEALPYSEIMRSVVHFEPRKRR